MNISMDYLITRAQLTFWRAVARLMRLALRHRQEVYRALTVAPIVIIATAAFIIGRGLGLMIEAGIF